MQDALVVRGGEPRAELARDLDRLVRRKPPDAPQERGQVLAVDVLHREEVPSLDLADVVDAADVGVGDAAREAHLGVEALEPGRLGRELRRQELQGDGLAELEVVGAVDLAHAAAADEADDAVALAEDRAGREAAAVERGEEAIRPTGLSDAPRRSAASATDGVARPVGICDADLIGCAQAGQ